MSKEEDNKAIVGRWFGGFWGEIYNSAIVDEITSPDMLLHYSLHEPRRGQADIKAFMADFRAAFPDLNFWGAADLIAEGDYVVGRWEGGGTHTGTWSTRPQMTTAAPAGGLLSPIEVMLTPVRLRDGWDTQGRVEVEPSVMLQA